MSVAGSSLSCSMTNSGRLYTTVTSADQLEFTWFVMLPVVLLYYLEEGCDFSTGLHLSLVDRVHYQGKEFLTVSHLNLVVMTCMKLKCRVVHCLSLFATGTTVLIITTCLLQVPWFLL